MICDLKGKKKKGFEINVQPASVRRSKDNGTRRRGRKALGTRRPPKDKTGPRKTFVLDDGETISLPCLGKQKKQKTNSFTIYRKQWTTLKPSQGDSQGNEYTPVLVIVNK